MKYETIQINVTPEKIGIITLNRPEKRNALSIQMRREISSCLEGWKNSDEVSVVIFTGAGPIFCAGFDLKEFGQADKAEEIVDSSARYHRDVWNFSKPTIAALNGSTFGGGFDLATLCDMRICTNSTVFGHPEIKFGAPPLYTPLRWIIGMGMARDLCLTGRTIDSKEALRIALVNEIVDDNVLDRAISIAKTIVEAPYATLQMEKKFFIDSSGCGFEESFVIEHDEPFQKLFIKQNKLNI